MKKKYSLLLVLALIVFMTGCTKPKVEVLESSVFIRINPEVELVVKEDVVIAANALNEDAILLLFEDEFIGKTIDEAIEIIFENSLEMGFLDETESNNIFVETINENDTERERIEQKVRNRLNEIAQRKELIANVVLARLSSEIKEQAEINNVSYGKMLIITRIMMLDDSYAIEDLKQMPLQELNEIFRENFKEFRTINQERRLELIEIRKQKREETKTKIEEFRQRILEQIRNSEDLTEEEVQNRFTERLNDIKEELRNRRNI